MKLNQDEASAKVKRSWLRHLHLTGLCIASSPRWGNVPILRLSHQFLTFGFMISSRQSKSHHLR